MHATQWIQFRQEYIHSSLAIKLCTSSKMRYCMIKSEDKHSSRLRMRLTEENAALLPLNNVSSLCFVTSSNRSPHSTLPNSFEPNRLIIRTLYFQKKESSFKVYCQWRRRESKNSHRKVHVLEALLIAEGQHCWGVMNHLLLPLKQRDQRRSLFGPLPLRLCHMHGTSLRPIQKHRTKTTELACFNHASQNGS